MNITIATINNPVIIIATALTLGSAVGIYYMVEAYRNTGN